MKKLLLASSFEKFADKLDTIPHPALPSLNVVCIPTAAYGEEEWDWLPRDMAPVQKRAKTFREFNIAGQSPADVRQALQGADVIYVTGGNTYYLLQMSDLTRRQQDWRSVRDKEAAELRDKVSGLDRTFQGFATGLEQLTHWYLGLAGLAGLMLGLIMFPTIASLMDWVRHVTGW